MDTPEEICQVHGERLRPMEARVRYGLPVLDREYIEAQAKLFPNAHSYVLGGCPIDAGKRKYVEKMVCLKCREVETSWTNRKNETSWKNRKDMFKEMLEEEKKWQSKAEDKRRRR